MWQDDWYAGLDTEHKLLWVYLFTNPSASVCGMYQLSVRVAAFDTGFEQDQVRAMLSDFVRDGKITWDGKVVWVHKLRELQETRSSKVQTRIAKDIAAIPDSPCKRAYLARYGMDTLSIPRRTETETDTDTETETETEARGDSRRSSSPSPDKYAELPMPPQPPEDDDPVLNRLMSYVMPYTQAVPLVAGRESLATAWMDHVDAHPGIPNKAAYLAKNIRAGKPPPTNGAGPPGAPAPRVTGLSEADLEWQREHERAKAAQKRTTDRAGPAAAA
jgi:hypothetical protein